MINLELWRDRTHSPRNVYTSWDNFGKEFDSFFSLFDNAQKADQAPLLSACDIQENDKGFLLSLDMPGIRKEDIQIDIKAQTLQVVGSRQREAQSENTRYHRTERRFGDFRRSFSLPENIDSDRIEASFENGVLYLALPKLEVEKSKRISIGDAKPNVFTNLLNLKSEDKNKKNSATA